ncbi:DNL zinc finger-domain-containing protein [Neocallimastix lanati (nom. inval.)]|jgi:hypothetical protein|nr:DNL zinc finger-domain-containing protein [Neocallimastix sp. JGI-2020a]
MQNLISNVGIKMTYNEGLLNQTFQNGLRNSFRNLNFICNSWQIRPKQVTNRRNLILPTGLFNTENNNKKFQKSDNNEISRSFQNFAFLTNYQNSLKCQSIRFFSKCNTNLDNASNGDNKNKIKMDTEKFLIGFTCKKCNNRSYKLISKKSYYEGVVIIRCDKCKNLHLIADHLGWYDSMNKFGTIEDYFKRQQNNPSGKTVIKKNLQQLTKTEQNDVIEFLKEEQKEFEEKKK